MIVLDKHLIHLQVPLETKTETNSILIHSKNLLEWYDFDVQFCEDILQYCHWNLSVRATKNKKKKKHE